MVADAATAKLQLYATVQKVRGTERGAMGWSTTGIRMAGWGTAGVRQVCEIDERYVYGYVVKLSRFGTQGPTGGDVVP